MNKIEVGQIECQIKDEIDTEKVRQFPNGFLTGPEGIVQGISFFQSQKRKETDSEEMKKIRFAICAYASSAIIDKLHESDRLRPIMPLLCKSGVLENLAVKTQTLKTLRTLGMKTTKVSTLLIPK